MRICRIGAPGREKPAMIDADGIARNLGAIVEDVRPETLESFVAAARQLDVATLPVIEPPFRYGPPVGGIGKLVCIGLNYRKHAEEAGMPLPQEPIFFLKANSAIGGPDDDIILPRGAEKGDWEIELGVVIGRAASYVDEAQAMAHVAGYCIVNDVSERAFQLERGSQWTKGKSCDTFGPIGPWLVTPDDIPDPHALFMQLRLNGELMQDGCSDDLVFGIPRLISDVSRYFTLHPGDIIATGTPSGVGSGLNPPRFLRPGDRLELRIDKLGEQHQMVRAWER